MTKYFSVSLSVPRLSPGDNITQIRYKHKLKNQFKEDNNDNGRDDYRTPGRN